MSLDAAEAQVLAERCKRDPHYCIFEAGVLYTKDEHDAEHPVKLAPDRPYLRAMLDVLLVSGRLMAPERAAWALAAGVPPAELEFLARSGLLFIEKSRDMFATNIVCCYLLWRARAFPYQLLMVQSKREEDAAMLVYKKEPRVAKISFMEDRLPPPLRLTTWPRSGADCRLYFDNGSQVWAIPEGGDVIRSQHPSVILSDEAAFQPAFGAAYTAALPAVKGGGQFIALSSANPGEFATLVGAAPAEAAA